jgi:hypothetical protein
MREKGYSYCCGGQNGGGWPDNGEVGLNVGF